MFFSLKFGCLRCDLIFYSRPKLIIFQHSYLIRVNKNYLVSFLSVKKWIKKVLYRWFFVPNKKCIRRIYFILLLWIVHEWIISPRQWMLSFACLIGCVKIAVLSTTTWTKWKSAASNPRIHLISRGSLVKYWHCLWWERY